MRARAALCRQLEHLRAERGYDAAAGRHLRSHRAHRGTRPARRRACGTPRVFGMADPDAEQEPARVRLLDAVIGLRDLVRPAPTRC